ncbi:hypothetical protein PS880_05889 [Pseudomonas fluorescens]|uniref:Transposase n=1 Tax=Pseudomonas fluorescens TaxID=294 RepID=A0A5E7Q8J9_PSEFL|nr:hypothetical protein PS880_05889 [Pseudomonas fluorescens]
MALIENCPPPNSQCSPAFGLQRSFSLINELDEQYGVNNCCRAFGVNRSSFYAWRQRQGKVKPEREKLNAMLVEHHKESRASAVSRTLSKELQAKGIVSGDIWLAA